MKIRGFFALLWAGLLAAVAAFAGQPVAELYDKAEYRIAMRKAGADHWQPVLDAAAKRGLEATGLTAFSDSPALKIVEVAQRFAGGRVVFADWMRGFGNLLIVDHGDAYLSIYGNNDSLLKQVGQSVKGGETVATVGNSGGNPESGLYFELRHQGQPIDPMKWASLK